MSPKLIPNAPTILKKKKISLTKKPLQKIPTQVSLEKEVPFSKCQYIFIHELWAEDVLSVKSSLTSTLWLRNKVVVCWVWIWFSISPVHFCYRSCFHWYSCLNCLLLEFSNPSQILILQPFSTYVRRIIFQFPSNNALECMVLQSSSEGHKTTLVLWR